MRLRTLLLGLTAWVVFGSIASAQIPAIERYALTALYNATNGDEWKNRANWRNAEDTDFNDPGTECSWKGIPCSEGRVESLYLPKNRLVGTIPPEIGYLGNLRIITFDGPRSTDPPRGLQGPIPSEIGNLTHLSHLSISFNQLSGSIPPELGNLKSLRYLELCSNRLSGSIPPEVGNLENLEFLGLFFNQLVGSIPPEIGNLENLEFLYLHSNRLSGSIPPEIGSLERLRYLDLSSNQLSGSIPPRIGNLEGLIYLILGSNQLSGSIPSEIGRLASLQRLYLNSNQLRREIPAQLTNLPNLYEVDIRWNALYTTNSTVKAFLDAKQPGWSDTQTVAPIKIAAEGMDSTSILVSWSPVAYVADAGGYEIHTGPAPGGPYSLIGTVAEKEASSFLVSGLTPDTLYYAIVKTYTEPHADNLKRVISDPSVEVWARTLPKEPVRSSAE